MTKVLSRNRFRAFVVASALAVLFAQAYPKAFASREAGGLGQPLTDIQTLAVDVGQLGNCQSTGTNCTYSTSAGCGSCGAAYGGAPCGVGYVSYFPPGYFYTPASCTGPNHVVCMPDPSSFATCCTWTDDCCTVTQTCTTSGACACLAGQPPRGVGGVNKCYTGPWGPGTTPPCPGP